MTFYGSAAKTILLSGFCIMLIGHTNSAHSAARETCAPEIEQAQKDAATLAAQNQLEVHQAAHEPTPSVHQLTCSDKTAQEDASKAGKIFSDVGAHAANLAQNVQQSVVQSGQAYIQSSFQGMLSGGSFASIMPVNFGSLIPSLGSFGLGSPASPCPTMKNMSDAVRAEPFMKSGMEFMNIEQFAAVPGGRAPVSGSGLAGGIKSALLSSMQAGSASSQAATGTAAQRLINQTAVDGSCGAPMYTGATIVSNPGDTLSGQPDGFCLKNCTYRNGSCI